MMNTPGNNFNKITPKLEVRTSNQELIRTLQQNKSFNLSNGEKITTNEIFEWFDDACDRLISKYGFNPIESQIFKGNVTINPCNTELGGLRGESSNQIQKFDDGQRKPICKISINPNFTQNKLFYKAVLIHELDHHAFVVKKFLNSKLYQCNFISQYNEQNARQEFSEQSNLLTSRFSTELIARVDTADELMKMGIPRDKIRKYGPGNEHETSGEAFYTESILYAQKFLSFQIGLYNLLAKHYGLDSSKQINQQLPNNADNQFQTIMNRLRNEIINSPSIERSKNLIDSSYRKLQESRGSRNEFCSLRTRNN